jgi:hypothetical protein
VAGGAVADQLGVSDVALRKHLKVRGVTQLPDGRRKGASRPRSATGNGTPHHVEEGRQSSA